MVTGTSRGHQRVPPKALKRCEVLSGTPGLFGKFDELVATMLDRAIANRAEARALSALRDTLLPKLVSGELRLGETVERLESAA